VQRDAPERAACRSNAVKDDEKCARHNDGERKPGTAPKLTSELADRLVALLQAGNYVAVAAREVGISRAVFYQWIDRGASSAAVDRPYRELRERVEHAKAQAEARNVASIANAARQNWQAAAWLLERSTPTAGDARRYVCATHPSKTRRKSSAPSTTTTRSAR
jgi:hypothetical protein